MHQITCLSERWDIGEALTAWKYRESATQQLFVALHITHSKNVKESKRVLVGLAELWTTAVRCVREKTPFAAALLSEILKVSIDFSS